MKRIYHHLSDDTLKELYVAVKRAENEFMNSAPTPGVIPWYDLHEYGSAQMAVECGVSDEMRERGLLNEDNEVVS